ncbi:hypothetical protein M422DRAFT_50286 [Sphaerobolus stellatus SS14]|uniref:Protein SDA1 n=1 Tax=Sphaerobolus stellatus (strain SS14) TaxID=990650 RepID=A0A0C9V830_SPHS4|nr:hypothetical protein M422DRAFT_50286 [Sphaerobolus stellatus SS14]
MITEACDNTDSFNAAQVKEFLKLLLLGIRQTKRALADAHDSTKVWNPASIAELSRKLRSSRFQTSTSLHGLFNQILAGLDWKNDGGEDAIMKDATKDKKRKAEDGKEDEERKKAKRKKVKSKGSKDN